MPLSLIHKLNAKHSTLAHSKVYFCNRIFLVETENKFTDSGNTSFVFLHVSILEPLLFFIYVNDMPQAVKSNLLWYVDDSCLTNQQKEIAKIAEILNKDFENICYWSYHNKLSIHFWDGKTKSFFASKQRDKNISKLNEDTRK